MTKITVFLDVAVHRKSVPDDHVLLGYNASHSRRTESSAAGIA
jgi:hypothetical protein